MSKFLQFHTLTSYPGTLLNRDDAGFAKTLPFGNAKRTRVSSQCLKYHWRHYDGKHAIRKAGDMSIRSRRTFRKKIADELVDEGFDERLTAAVTFGILEMARNGDVTKGAIKDNVQPVLEADDPLDELTIKNIVVFGDHAPNSSTRYWRARSSARSIFHGAARDTLKYAFSDTS